MTAAQSEKWGHNPERVMPASALMVGLRGRHASEIAPDGLEKFRCHVAETASRAR